MTNRTNRIYKNRDLAQWESLAMEHLAILQNLQLKLESVQSLHGKDAELCKSAKAVVNQKLNFLARSESHWFESLNVEPSQRRFKIGRIGVIFCLSGTTGNQYDMLVYIDVCKWARYLTRRTAQKPAHLGTTTTTNTPNITTDDSC